MTLQGYLARLADTLHSRHDITLEELRLMLTTVGAIFQANARFYGGSRLLIVEEVERVSSRDVRRPDGHETHLAPEAQRLVDAVEAVMRLSPAPAGPTLQFQTTA